MAVPAGVEHGDRFSFTVWLPRGPRTRVDVRVDSSPLTGHSRPVGGTVKRHVEFLSTLYVVWGAIFVLVALAGFALAVGACAIAESTRTGAIRIGNGGAAHRASPSRSSR